MGEIQYVVELMAPSIGAFTPILPHTGSEVSKGKKPDTEIRNSEDNIENARQLVYASQVVEIVTDPREDDPLPISYIENRLQPLN